jgi:hypothetical protein
MDYDIRKLNDYLWELPKTGGMRVPARIYATEEMIAQIVSDKAPQQVANVAHLPASSPRRSQCQISIGVTASRSVASRHLISMRESSRPAASATTSTAACD